jgi:uncharacterized surface protein with fasciclin (FAS1) repeats
LTVFAPTDSAFVILPDGALESLLKPENRDSLRAVLLHHVIEGDVSLPALLREPQLTTLSGQHLRVSTELGVLRLGPASIATAELRCENGIIHVVDRVLLPELRDLATIAVEAGTFETLVAAAEAGGLLDALKGDAPLTVFAPTDAAFAALPEGTVESLLEPENRAALERVLMHHIVEGRVFADGAEAAGTASTLAGTELRFGYAYGLQVNGIRITGPDIPARNGVIHAIEAVLLPPEIETAPRDSQADARTRAIRVIETAIETGVPLFNDGNPEACCRVYELAVIALIGMEGDLFSRGVRDQLSSALESSEAPNARAWTLRRALDAAYREARDERRR